MSDETAFHLVQFNYFSYHILTFFIISYPLLSSLIFSYPLLSSLIFFYLLLSSLIFSYLLLSSFIFSYLLLSFFLQMAGLGAWSKCLMFTGKIYKKCSRGIVMNSDWRLKHAGGFLGPLRGVPEAIPETVQGAPLKCPRWIPKRVKRGRRSHQISCIYTVFGVCDRLPKNTPPEHPVPTPDICHKIHLYPDHWEVVAGGACLCM